jgi:mRNA interferase RelE/StbE
VAYEVRLKPSAERKLRKLPRDAQQRIARRLDGFAAEPRPSGCERLSGLDDLYRVRVGDYRIVYEIEDDILVVLVITIGHRRDVYRRL